MKKDNMKMYPSTGELHRARYRDPRSWSLMFVISWVAVLLLATKAAVSAATHQVSVGVNGDAFEPSTLTIQPGDTVTWTYPGGTVPHTVTSGDNGQRDGLFDGGGGAKRFTFSFTFPKAGKFPYFCVYHYEMGMDGEVIVVDPNPQPSQPLNISTRLRVQTDENVMIGGFIITGNAPKKLIVRALGPSLQQLGITDALADPVVELRSGNTLVLGNDNWKDNQQAEIQATGLQPTNNLEGAVLVSLTPGSYTAIVSGKNATKGVGLVEVYDLDTAADSKLANISTRGFVETGSNVMIGGFILGGGSGNATVLVRAIGPSLVQFGINNALADPTLELHDGNGALLKANDNWKESQQTEIEATGLQPHNNFESAILASLPPGPSTAIVAGKNGTSGVGLVEVYRLQ